MQVPCAKLRCSGLLPLQVKASVAAATTLLATANLALLLPLQVGWNDANKYWLVRNSFGTGFADAGYFRVRWLVLQSLCATRGRRMHIAHMEQQLCWESSLVSESTGMQVGYGESGLAPEAMMFSFRWQRE
jgi:hypothetical protein